MLTLYSYPDLFGVADNNAFGLKIYAFMRLCGLDFGHQHILDTSHAPRGPVSANRSGFAGGQNGSESGENAGKSFGYR